ncbi:MAG: hypothetical protein ACI8ZM_001182 [Crocinitomix sp.]|jgi:hypothetical protein
MNLRIANIRFGFTMLFISAAVGGMALGGTFNDYSVNEGNHVLGLARFYLREGHSHGNFMCFFNLFVGIILNHLTLTEKWKKICSYTAMGSIILPLGLMIKGAMGAAEEVFPIGLIGILCIAISLIILIIGAFKTKMVKA